jgi:hypothetical protein
MVGVIARVVIKVKIDSKNKPPSQCK